MEGCTWTKYAKTTLSEQKRRSSALLQASEPCPLGVEAQALSEPALATAATVSEIGGLAAKSVLI